jgi:hypothetical protein
VFEIDFVPDRRQAAQQLRLLLRPGVEIFLIEKSAFTVILGEYSATGHSRKVQPNESETW